MINTQNNPFQSCQHDVTFDDLMASLFVLITHYSLKQDDSVLNVIVDRLDFLCQHDDIEFYPNQLLVLTKMKRLWQTRLFDIEISEAHH